MKNHMNIVVDKRTELSDSSPNVQVISSSSNLLSQLEKDALKEAISDKLFSEFGWQKHLNGRVKNEYGKSLYKPGYISAITKVLEIS